MLTQEQLEEVAGVVWAPILKWSRAVGMMGREEGGAVLFLSILSTSPPPLGKDQVNLTSLPDSCSPPEPQGNSRRGGSCRPPPVCQMCIQLYGCHCGPSCRRHTSHKLLSLRLRQAEKRICSKVQVIIKTQPVPSQCPGWRPPWLLPPLNANETSLWVQSLADWLCP